MKILKTLKILDDDETLSLSHISLAITLGLLAVNPCREYLIAFVLSIANFNGKKWFGYLKSKKDLGDRGKLEAMKKDVDRLEKEFQKLNMAATFKQLGR